MRLYQVQETSPCELELTNNIKCWKRLEIAGKFEFLFKMARYLNGGIVWFFIIRVFLAAGVLASSRIWGVWSVSAYPVGIIHRFLFKQNNPKTQLKVKIYSLCKAIWVFLVPPLHSPSSGSLRPHLSTGMLKSFNNLNHSGKPRSLLIWYKTGRNKVEYKM